MDWLGLYMNIQFYKMKNAERMFKIAHFVFRKGLDRSKEMIGKYTLSLFLITYTLEVMIEWISNDIYLLLFILYILFLMSKVQQIDIDPNILYSTKIYSLHNAIKGGRDYLAKVFYEKNIL